MQASPVAIQSLELSWQMKSFKENPNCSTRQNYQPMDFNYPIAKTILIDNHISINKMPLMQ